MNEPKNHRFSLQPRWPSAFPTKCQSCHGTYDIRGSIEIMEMKLGRYLKRFSLVLFTPPMLIYALGAAVPKQVRLYCYKCHRKEYHPLSKNWAGSSAWFQNE